MKVQKWSLLNLTGLLALVTVLCLGCAKDKKSSSPTPAAVPPPVGGAYMQPGCPPGGYPPGTAPQPGMPPCQAQGNIGVPPQPYPNSGYQYGAGYCPQGQIYTAYNCLPIAGCPANQGMYNNTCVPAMVINQNGLPNGYSYQNGYWGSSYNGYPYYNGGYNNNSYYSGGYPYYYSSYGYPYSQNLGLGFSLWIR